jgi:hypothetical protein
MAGSAERCARDRRRPHFACARRRNTQPPILTAKGPAYAEGATFASFVASAGAAARQFPDLPGAWRIAIEVEGAATRWPWRASLAMDRTAKTYNRANLYLPAQPGSATHEIAVSLPASAHRLRLTLLKDGEEHGTRELAL